jgi:hypothetical protein
MSGGIYVSANSIGGATVLVDDGDGTHYRIRMDHASARALVAQLEAAMSTSITLDTVADDTERPS